MVVEYNKTHTKTKQKQNKNLAQLLKQIKRQKFIFPIPDFLGIFQKVLKVILRPRLKILMETPLQKAQKVGKVHNTSLTAHNDLK